MKLQYTLCKFLAMQKICETKILELFCVYFMKLDIFENFIGKILHLANKVCHKLNKLK